MNTKVQKNHELENSHESLHNLNIAKSLNDEQIRKAVLDIITDHIVYSRLCDGIKTILNVYDPIQDKYDVGYDGYTGYDNALRILGITELNDFDELHTSLSIIITQQTYNNKCNIVFLAEYVLSEWEKEIKNYFSTKNH